MTALMLVIASMVGCPSVVAPRAPVPVVTPVRLTRCDPGRLGWAADGTFWFVVQAEPVQPVGL